jgi:hypothetical protein
MNLFMNYSWKREGLSKGPHVINLAQILPLGQKFRAFEPQAYMEFSMAMTGRQVWAVER